MQNKNKVGLAVGLWMMIVHAVWLFFVGVAPQGLQSFMNWIFGLHHLNNPYAIMPFAFSKAIMLLIVTLIFGYIFGWLLAFAWKWAHKR